MANTQPALPHSGDRIELDLSPDAPVALRVNGQRVDQVTGIRIQQMGQQDPAIFLSFRPLRQYDAEAEEALVQQHFRYQAGTVVGRLVREEEWAIYAAWREEYLLAHPVQPLSQR